MTTLVMALIVLAMLIAVVVGLLLIDAYENGECEWFDGGLNAAWRSLHAANRINTAFWIARDQMRREMERQRRNRL